MTSHTDDVIDAQRVRQREVLTIVPSHIRDVLMPDIDRSRALPDSHEQALIERALRERADALVNEEALLAQYLERARRHRHAAAIGSWIASRYRELAADGPEAMDLERAHAESLLDKEVDGPSYAEGMMLARLIPLLAWADFLAG